MNKRTLLSLISVLAYDPAGKLIGCNAMVEIVQEVSTYSSGALTVSTVVTVRLTESPYDARGEEMRIDRLLSTLGSSHNWYTPSSDPNTARLTNQATSERREPTSNELRSDLRATLAVADSWISGVQAKLREAVATLNTKTAFVARAVATANDAFDAEGAVSA